MRKFILFLATGAGSGYFPWFPGTAGSAVGLLLFYLLKNLPVWPYLLTLLALIFLAAWVSTIAEILFQERDSHRIVIDEIVGILVTFAMIPFSIKVAAIGFVFFRIFDIWKPFPVRLFQDKLPGGWGVVGDDVMAGIYANIILQGVTRIYGF